MISISFYSFWRYKRFAGTSKEGRNTGYGIPAAAPLTCLLASWLASWHNNLAFWIPVSKITLSFFLFLGGLRDITTIDWPACIAIDRGIVGNRRSGWRLWSFGGKHCIVPYRYRERGIEKRERLGSYSGIPIYLCMYIRNITKHRSRIYHIIME